MSFTQRTIDCGAVRASHEGQTVTLNGWVHRVRNLGGLYFVDLRDRTGLVQLFWPNDSEKPDLRPETCVSITGVVKLREAQDINPKSPTGEVDIVVTSTEILGQSRVLPFPVSDESQMLTVNEELRIKHRYLDLRRPKMYKIFALRAALISGIRRYMDARGFLEVETPIITKSTPEGARDYLVPYRLEPGKFYALPQSPQQYKQLLMVSGFERYYQIAKCFRDESQRSDRQPEFTQLDIEMSFTNQEEILNLVEGLILDVLNGVITQFSLDKDLIVEFPRLTYQDALRLYGSDKPDLRFGLQIFDLTPHVKNSEFSVFKNTAEAGGMVRGIRYPGGAALSRREVTALEDFCKQWGAKGMASLAVNKLGEGETEIGNTGLTFRGSIAKFLSAAEQLEIFNAAQAQEGDLLCLIADQYSASNEVLNRLRLEIGGRCGLRDPRKLAFAWVVDFPLFEWDEESKSWSPSHHPFTSPKHEDLEFLDSDPGKVRADCYDLVCNGTEMASGSIRIHRSDVQAKIFSMLGIDEQTQRERFGHILDAFSFGAPPHGGMAPGIDRLIMALCDTENIREVIAFPKMGNGFDPMMEAPSTIDAAQWKELGIELTKKQ